MLAAVAARAAYGAPRVWRSAWYCLSLGTGRAQSGPNPTLTSQALATRTAEKIFETYFGGDPWVRTGSPVVSTDPRISVRLRQLGL